MPRATFDAAGRVTGLYDDSMPAPTGAVTISDTDRTHLAGFPDAWRWSGSAVVAYTPPVVTSTKYDFLAFLGLFSSTEQTGIVNSTDPRVRLFCLMAAGAAFVDLTDTRVVSGTKLLESLGIIATGRAAQVLAGQAPPVA